MGMSWAASFGHELGCLIWVRTGLPHLGADWAASFGCGLDCLIWVRAGLGYLEGVHVRLHAYLLPEGDHEDDACKRCMHPDDVTARRGACLDLLDEPLGDDRVDEEDELRGAAGRRQGGGRECVGVVWGFCGRGGQQNELRRAAGKRQGVCGGCVGIVWVGWSAE